MQVSNFVWSFFKPIWREPCLRFLFMSWFLFYDKNRKIFHKLKKNHFLNNIKKKLGPRIKIGDTVPSIIVSRLSTQNLKSLVSILTELSTFKNIIAKNRNLYTRW